MKAKLLLALIFVAMPLLAQDNSPTVFHSNGAFAQLSAFNNGTMISMGVSRGTDVTGKSATFLSYQNISFTPDGFIETFGSGTVPNSSFTGADPVHLVFSVDTSQLPDFAPSTCTISFVDFGVTCVPAPLGIIQLEWRQNGILTLHTTSDTMETNLQVRIHQHTEADTALADVRGSFLGLDVSGQFGQAGVNHNSSIQIDKIR